MTSRPLQLVWVDGRPRVLRYGRPLGEPAAATPAPVVTLEQARAVLEARPAWRAVLEAGPDGAAHAEQLEQLEAEAEAEQARAAWRRACLHG